MISMPHRILSVGFVTAMIVVLATGQVTAQAGGSESAWTPPPAMTYPTARLPGWDRAQAGSFQFNPGEGGITPPAATTSRLPFVDGHRQAWSPAAGLNTAGGN
ncbi:MAG: hypothetical protein NW217_04935 [Hyphomicrobiaceae bacterium]|nr:hypothetical protein [Hyphomicrobiaceae bacterium]